jgi:hypothetical protein
MQFPVTPQSNEVLHYERVRALVYFQISKQLVIFQVWKVIDTSKNPHQVNKVGEEKISTLNLSVFSVVMTQV